MMHLPFIIENIYKFLKHMRMNNKDHKKLFIELYNPTLRKVISSLNQTNFPQYLLQVTMPKIYKKFSANG